MWGRLTRIILQSLPRYPFPSRPSFLLSCRRVYSHLSWHLWLLHFVRFLFVYLLDFVRHRVRVLRNHDVVMLSLFRHVISRRCSAFSKVDFGREGNAELCTFFLAGDVCLRPPFFFEDFNLSKLMWSMSYCGPVSGCDATYARLFAPPSFVCLAGPLDLVPVLLSFFA